MSRLFSYYLYNKRDISHYSYKHNILRYDRLLSSTSSTSSTSLSTSTSTLNYENEVISKWNLIKSNINNLNNSNDITQRIKTTEMMKDIFSKLVSKTINDEINRVSSSILPTMSKSQSTVSAIATVLNENIETQVLKYLDNCQSKKAINFLINSIDNSNVIISEKLCNSVLKEAVNECLWMQAAQIASYNIKLGRSLLTLPSIPSSSSSTSNIEDDKRLLFYIIGGLIKDPNGAVAVLNMMADLVTKHDDSMSLSFHFNKAEKFGSGTGKRYNLWKEDRQQWKLLLKDPLRHAMDKSIEAATQGWYSIPMLKTIIALGCKSEHYNLTSHFMITMIDILDYNKKKSGEKNSFFDLLLCFKEGVCSGIIHEDDPNSLSVLNAPLDIAMKKIQTAGDITLLQSIEFVKFHWVLSNRIRQVIGSIARSSLSSSNTNILIDTSTKKCYNDLIKLYHDTTRTSDDYKPAPGHERRTFRILCDELGFRHKIIDDRSNSTSIVRAWKSNVHTVIPPKLEELLRVDNINVQEYRKFDGTPVYFNEIKSLLAKSNKDYILHICMNLTKSMAAVYPSPQWAFHLIDFLRQNGFKIPRALLRNVMQMCERRADIYGILEILRIQHEMLMHNSKIRSNIFSSNTESAKHDYLPFEQRDWYNALKFSLQSLRWKTMPQKSLEEAFTEILGLMQSSGIELNLREDPDTTKILLQFALEISSTAQITNRIFKKLYRDKKIPISHIECLSLTSLILNTLNSINDNTDTGLLSLSKPLYKSENYLVANPRSLDKLFKLIIKHNDVLGQEFLNNCEAIWKVLKSQEGRFQFYNLMMHTVSLKGKRTDIIQNFNDDVRGTVTIIGVYAAYLISYYEKDYRKAYDLLYAIYSLNEDAELQKIL